jgi:hypothetical protein
MHVVTSAKAKAAIDTETNSCIAAVAERVTLETACGRLRNSSAITHLLGFFRLARYPCVFRSATVTRQQRVNEDDKPMGKKES